MRVGVVGFGPFGQFVAQVLLPSCSAVRVANRLDKSYAQAIENNSIDPRFEFYRLDDMATFAEGLEVIILAVSISSLEAVLSNISPNIFCGKLVVDVCSVKMYPRDVMTRLLPPSADILCTHPMFGPRSASGPGGLQGQRFMFDRSIRITDISRCEAFLDIWKSLQCVMIDMTCEAHDEYAAKSQFITHFTARSLNLFSLEQTPIDTPSYRTLCDFTTGLCQDSPDLFAALYRYNPFAAQQVVRLKEVLCTIEQDLQQGDREGLTCGTATSTPPSSVI